MQLAIQCNDEESIARQVVECLLHAATNLATFANFLGKNKFKEGCFTLPVVCNLSSNDVANLIALEDKAQNKLNLT